MTEFKVGDIVTFGGLEGQVDVIYECAKFPVIVHFKNQTVVHFTLDGRYLHSHTTPTLILKERPKKKVKKIVEKWVNLYSYGDTGYVYDSQEAADRGMGFNRFTCIKLTGEYEVEEDAG